MYETLIRGDVPDPKTLLQQEDIVNLKRRAQSLHTQRSLPPVVTHNMVDGDRDGSYNFECSGLFYLDIESRLCVSLWWYFSGLIRNFLE
jgi:hypothetical protein